MSSLFYIAVECHRLGNLRREEKLFISDSIRGWESNIKVLESSGGPCALWQGILRREGGKREGRKNRDGRLERRAHEHKGSAQCNQSCDDQSTIVKMTSTTQEAL